MKFSFEIDSRNAAMTGGGRREVARLLRKVAGHVEAGAWGGPYLMDSNGNRCGEWSCDDERPDFEGCEAADLFKLADDYAIILDDDPRKLSRAELVEGLESIGVACYDEESDELLAEAYGDSMLAGDLPGECDSWRDDCREEWGE
jgi:hypothetical protein